MIYIIILIIIIGILAFTQMTLNRHYGKISDIPLRKKIVQDVTNLILFLIIFWCLLNTHINALPIWSLIILTLSLVLFLHRDTVQRFLLMLLDKIREKIAFPTSFGSLIRRIMKNWKIQYKRNLPKDKDIQRNEVYKEHIALTVIFFSKRTVIMGLILSGCLNFIHINQPEVLEFITSEQSAKYFHTFSDLFVLINNTGLIFTCWKFYRDYKAIKNEKNDNPRYLTLVKRMLRSEHEI